MKTKEVESIEKLSPISYKIQGEISEILNKYGAPVGLISVINSWGDTLTSEDVLKSLKEFNNLLQHQSV